MSIPRPLSPAGVMPRVMPRAAARAAALALLLVYAAPSAAQEARCIVTSDSAAATASAHWSAPLDRRVSLRAANISLRDALDRVAVEARLRLSYSAELLPLDRATCVLVTRAAVGDVLTALLDGTNVTPVAVGDDLVALAPRGPAAASRTSEPATLSTVNVLDRVVVTGSASGAPERDLTMALDVVDGRKLAADDASSLSAALDNYVPGIWSWPQSPTSLLESYGSIRGASSFTLSYPKVYIDGIEVANPLLVGRFAPDAIDRIEVIRGPQGSALYGTDAISGVVNIVSRHESTDVAGTHFAMRSTAGVTESAFAHDALSQEHELSMLTGSSTRSASLHVLAGSVGDFVPQGHSEQVIANGTGRVVGEHGTLSGTARYFYERAGSPRSPLLPSTQTATGTGIGASDLPPQSVGEYTLGGTATLTTNERWTHSVVAGIDGYRLANVQASLTPIPTGADSALRAAQGGADRATLRASSVLQLAPDAPTHATLTVSAEHATLRANTLALPDLDDQPTPQGRMPVPRLVESWQNTTGISGQVAAGFANTFYLTTALGVERDSRLETSGRLATLPMIGGAIVRDIGPVTIKLRSSYGRGVRPPTTVSHASFWQSAAAANSATLGAEVQSGVESGVDVMLARALTLRVTRFDQRASGLIQEVLIAGDTMSEGYGEAHHLGWTLQNVGEITNRGWELGGSTNLAHLNVAGTLTFVDSRVEKLATGYTGDLAQGDRMLQVPAQTGSLTASWIERHWTAALTATRAVDWINYDEVAYAQAFANGAQPARDLYGASLRQFWRRYNGGLRLGMRMTRDLRDLVSLEVSADNLLNYQLDEPDNATVLPGRTLMTGLRVKF